MIVAACWNLWGPLIRKCRVASGSPHVVRIGRIAAGGIDLRCRWNDIGHAQHGWGEQFYGAGD
jgi:hypothetical protein